MCFQRADVEVAVFGKEEDVGVEVSTRVRGRVTLE
jgi:hypothetical protein